MAGTTPAGYDEEIAPPPSSPHLQAKGMPKGYDEEVPPPTPDNAPPGFFGRLAESFGIPTSMEQAKAMGEQFKPQLSDIITPGGPAGRVMLTSAYKGGKQAISEGIKEGQEAGQNIAAGQPVLPNVGKAVYGGVHAAAGVLSPLGGQTVEHAGEDVAAKNYWGAAGGLTGIVSQLALMKTAENMPKKPTTIKGVEFPETVGQKYGSPGGFTQTLEHYTSGTFMGTPLKEVAQGQQAAARQVMADLAGQPGTPEMLAGNWGAAAKQVRANASPMYESLAELPADHTIPVAKGILADPDVAPLLNSAAKRELAKLVKGGTSAMPEGIAKQYVDLGGELTHTGAKVGDAMKARSELGSLASQTIDRGNKRLLVGALSDLDSSINSGLNPEQLATRQSADILTRRAYIMDKARKSLEGIEASQTPGRSPVIISNRFNRMVNDLVRTKDMDVLFPNPSDRQAMSQLAQFLAEKNSTLKGQAGVAEGIARIGMTLEAARVPTLLLKGSAKAAGNVLGTLAGYKILVNIMAHPGGAAEILRFLETSVPAEAAMGRSSQDIINRAKNGEIPPGEADRQIIEQGGKVKVKPIPEQP